MRDLRKTGGWPVAFAPARNTSGTTTSSRAGAGRPPTAVRPVSRGRLAGFRVAAILTGLLLLLAGAPALLAPWWLPADTGDAHAEAHRWFITVSGTADTIGAIALLVLAFRPALVLLAVETLVAVVLAAVINMPVDPWFGVIVLIMTPMLVLYPHWPRVRDVRTWWATPIKPLLLLGLATTTVLVGIGTVAIVRQFTAEDSAAAANWWSDYAEHLVLLGVVLLFAATRLPGWRVLAAAASAGWIYLGLTATLLLPNQTASWGTPYGLFGVLLGAATATTLSSKDNALRTRQCSKV